MNDRSKLIARLKQQPRQGSNALDELQKAINSIYKSFETGGQDVVRASGFKALTDAVIGTYEKLNVLEQRNRKVAEGFGVSTGRAAQLSQKFDQLGISIGVNTDKLKQYAVELKKLFPGQAAYLANGGKFATQISKQAELLRNKLGLTGEQTEKFMKNQTLMVGASADGYKKMTADIAEYSKGLRGQYDGAFGDIMDSIANLDAETAAVFGKSGVENLSKAALNAKKLGTELNKVLATGDNFLDVEQAISKELSLQLLGGKELNVDKIQQARLSGNAADLTEQLTTFLENNGELMKSNAYFLQDAAEATGFSKSELLEMYAQLQANNALELEGSKNKEALAANQAEINALIERENKLRKARGEKDMDTQEEEIFLADKRSEATKKQDKAQQKYAESLGTDQVDRVLKLSETLDKTMTTALGSADKVISALSTSDFIKQLIGLGGTLSSFRELLNSMKTSTAGPGESEKVGDLFIPANGSSIITGEYGSFTTTPGDDILAGPGIREATNGGSTAAVIAALSKMSFHVTNVFDGDKIKSSLEIRQGQTLNNINNIA